MLPETERLELEEQLKQDIGTTLVLGVTVQ